MLLPGDCHSAFTVPGNNHNDHGSSESNDQAKVGDNDIGGCMSLVRERWGCEGVLE
jgi:hypothetical protein